MTKYKQEVKDEKSFMKFAGAWKDIDTDKIKKDIAKGRQDGLRHQKILLKR